MDVIQWEWTKVLVIPFTGVISFLILLHHGCFRSDALADSPRRDIGIGLVDLWIGAVITLIGMLIAGWLMKRLGMTGQETQPPHELETEYLKRALLGQVVIQVPVVIFFVIRSSVRENGLIEVGLKPRQPVRELVLGLKSLIAVVPIAWGLSVIIEQICRLFDIPIPGYGHELLEAAVEAQSLWVVIGVAITAICVAPLVEEVIFRGLLQTALLDVVGREHRWLVVITSAGVFAMIHIGLPWQVLPSLFVLGIVLGWVYERSGSLWPAILIHAGFNGINLLLSLS